MYSLGQFSEPAALNTSADGDSVLCVWPDDDGKDTPNLGGIPDPSQRHWRHPSELSGLVPTESVATLEPSRRGFGLPLFGPLMGLCATLALIIVGLSTIRIADGQNRLEVSGAQEGDETIVSLALPAIPNSGSRTAISPMATSTNRTTTTMPAIQNAWPEPKSADALLAGGGVSSKTETIEESARRLDQAKQQQLESTTTSTMAPDVLSGPLEIQPLEVKALHEQPTHNSPRIEPFTRLGNVYFTSIDAATVQSIWVLTTDGSWFELTFLSFNSKTGLVTYVDGSSNWELLTTELQIGDSVSVGEQTGAVTDVGPHEIWASIAHDDSTIGTPVMDHDGTVWGVVVRSDSYLLHAMSASLLVGTSSQTSDDEGSDSDSDSSATDDSEDGSDNDSAASDDTTETHDEADVESTKGGESEDADTEVVETGSENPEDDAPQGIELEIIAEAGDKLADRASS